MRLILAALIVVATSASGIDTADAAKAKAKSRDLSRSTKLCVAARNDNRRVGWKCDASERCCWNAFAGAGSCAPANVGCF